MGKKLIIAEKPSVATDLQKVIGGMEQIKTEAGDYFEGDQYVVASAVGPVSYTHLTLPTICSV